MSKLFSFLFVFLAGCAATTPSYVKTPPAAPEENGLRYFDCVVEYAYSVSERAEKNQKALAVYLAKMGEVLPSTPAVRQQFDLVLGCATSNGSFDHQIDSLLLKHRKNRWRAGSELLKEARLSEQRDAKFQTAFAELVRVFPDVSQVDSEYTPLAWPAFTCYNDDRPWH